VYAVLIAVGLLILVVISVTAGMLLAGERLHRQREQLESRRWELWRWEQELVNTAELRGCRACQLLRRRADLQRSPTEPEAA
jgi:hypothetical protein